MSFEKELKARSGSKCELCSATENLRVYEIPPSLNGSFANSIFICETCEEQINDPEKINVNHWRCLNDSMWSEVPGVQVMAWRMLNRLRSEGWPADLLEMLYLDDDTLKWAKSTGEGDEEDGEIIKHLDSNGDLLQAGDNVILIKDLNVKGANFTAKRGTSVRRISLVHDNAEQIEGKVNGQHIVILTKFVKKSS
jgi:protein PhnA